MRKVKSRLALLLAVIMIAGSLQLPVFAVRRSGAGIPSGASAEAGVEDPGQVTETELLDLVPDSAGTGGTEPQDPVDTTWTVIFDANGGTFPGGETQISLDVEKGLAVQFNSEPLTTADRYFAGWKTQDGTLINDAYSFVPENDITLYAFWKDKKKVENISLNHHELTMSVGKTAALSATVLPEDAYDRSFTWKSGNPGVAAVNNNGKVTAAAKGTAVIKAAANDGSGVFAECKITVRQPVTSLTLKMDDQRQFSCDRLLSGRGQGCQERYGDDHGHSRGREWKESHLQCDRQAAGDKPDAEQDGFDAQ